MGRFAAVFVILALASVNAVEALDLRASLRGSAAAMQRQNRIAREHGLSFLRTGAEIRAAAAAGDLVELRGNEDYDVADFVVYPYARPELRVFVERLAAQYRRACGQKLVVTSLTRPSTRQPANAHALSVHPSGMAVDLRVSDRRACRAWLEETLLALERRGVLDGIREFHPPHYHVAVFPSQYAAYVEERLAAERAVRAAESGAANAGGAVTIVAIDTEPRHAPGTGSTDDARRRGPLSAAASMFLAAVRRFAGFLSG